MAFWFFEHLRSPSCGEESNCNDVHDSSHYFFDILEKDESFVPKSRHTEFGWNLEGPFDTRVEAQTEINIIWDVSQIMTR